MVAERVWIGLDAVAADGRACVMCGRSLRAGVVWVPVGRSHTGSQVFACVGSCAERAVATREVVAIPMEALTAGGAALLGVLDAVRAGGDLNRADPDDLVAAVVRAAGPLVAAAELRRLVVELDGTPALGTSSDLSGVRGEAQRARMARRVWAAGYLRSRADELDPAGSDR